MKLASALADKLGFPEMQIEKTLEGLRGHVAEQLSNGEKVVLPEFLIFDFNDKPERIRRNPRTGENVLVAPNRIPKTRFSQKFEQEVTLTGSAPTPPAFPPMPPPLPVTPPPLTVSEPEKIYHLPDGSQRRAGEAKTLPADSLIWNPEFGGSWRKVSEVFS